MARRTPRIVPGDIEYVPTSTAEQLAHADALRRHGQDHPDYRAQYDAEAAEHYAAAGHDETAEELFRAALEDGGHVAGSLHGYYAEFLFTRDRSDEALAQIDAARKQRPDDPDVFVIIGETLDAHGHHHEAARWLTTGLVRYYTATWPRSPPTTSRTTPTAGPWPPTAYAPAATPNSLPTTSTTSSPPSSRKPTNPDAHGPATRSA